LRFGNFVRYSLLQSLSFRGLQDLKVRAGEESQEVAAELQRLLEVRSELKSISAISAFTLIYNYRNSCNLSLFELMVQYSRKWLAYIEN
jgi:hypothetical protein